MLPKHSKHYIIPTAEQLEFDAQLVEDVVSFYYAELRKNLSQLKNHTIQVEELGTFKVKEQKLPGLIGKHERHLSVLTKDTFEQMALKKDVEQRLAQLKNIKFLIEQEKLRKKEFLKNKHNGLKENLDSTKTNS